MTQRFNSSPVLPFLTAEGNRIWPRVAWRYAREWIGKSAEKGYAIGEVDDYLQHLYTAVTAPKFQYQGPGQFYSFIKTVLRNRILSDIRKSVRARAILARAAALPPVVALSAAEEEAVQREAVEMLHKRLSRLPGNRARKLVEVAGRILARIGTTLPSATAGGTPETFLPFRKPKTGQRRGAWVWNYRHCAKALGIPERTLFRLIPRIDAIFDMRSELASLESDRLSQST